MAGSAVQYIAAFAIGADLDTNIGAVCSPYLAAAGPGSRYVSTDASLDFDTDRTGPVRSSFVGRLFGRCPSRIAPI